MGIFISERYVQALIYKIPQKTMESEVVVNELFKKLTLEALITDDVEKIKADIRQIGETTAGTELLKLLNNSLSESNPLMIRADFARANYNPEQHRIEYRPGDNYFYESFNSLGEKVLVKRPTFTVLAHEFLHVINTMEADELTKIRKVNKFIAPNMSNAEEQFVITGFTEVEADSDLPLRIKIENSLGQYRFFGLARQCCENSVLVALGLPPRISHEHAVASPGDQYPSFYDMVRLDAIGTIKEKLSSDRNFINAKTSFFKPLAPLHIAVAEGNVKVVKLLLEAGADVTLKDVEGRTALMIAQQKGYSDLAVLLNG